MKESSLRAVSSICLSALLALAASVVDAAAAIEPAIARAAGMQVYAVALTAPRFTLPDLSGNRRTNADYHGRVVLLNFWGSWCPPCREEFPSLERLQDKLKSRDFTVLAITVADTRAGVERFLGGRQPDFDILLDETKATAQAFRAMGVPVTYLLDRQGRLLAGRAGPHQWDDPGVVKLIEHALNKTGGK